MTNTNDDYMLTTFDNPFNPFKDFEAWWKYDLILGHDCCGLLARVARTSEMFSDSVNEKLIDDAMNQICSEEPMIYKKVSIKDYEPFKLSKRERMM